MGGPARGRTTWRAFYVPASDRLGSPQVARWLLEEASGGAWPGVLDEPVPAPAGLRFSSMVERRLSGEPVQYVLGHWAFRTLDLMLDRRVLIPRPETEVVVGVALEELARLGAAAPLVVDLGTGSGAIALSIAAERADAEIWATDVSGDALAVASANLAGVGSRAAERVRLAQGSWWGALPPALKSRVSMAVANPPYIGEGELANLPPEVSDWEPVEALVAGPSGLEALQAVLQEAPAWLAPSSTLVAEIAPHQSEAVSASARSAGFGEVLVVPDLTGRLRVLVARR